MHGPRTNFTTCVHRMGNTSVLIIVGKGNKSEVEPVSMSNSYTSNYKHNSTLTAWVTFSIGTEILEWALLTYIYIAAPVCPT